MYQPEQRVIHLRATQPNHQWAMEMMRESQIHHRDGKNWVVIRETLNEHGLHVTIQEVTLIKTQEKTEAKTMTTEIEKTKRDMYADLKRFESMVGSTHLFKTFQDSLEAHLEELRKANSGLVEMFVREKTDVEIRLANMTEERDQIQGRLHAIDHAYNEQQKAMGIAGEELIRVQGIARQHLDDCRLAEKMSDEFSEKLTHATTVIGQQEQLIAGQRRAIAELFGLKNRKPSVVKCAHEFHPAFPGGERCVYCCQEKLTPAGETMAQMEKNISELCTNYTHIQDCKCGRG